MDPILAPRVVAFLAETAPAPMPLPKVIMGILLFGGIGIGCCLGAVAPSSTLQHYSGVIGTTNPVVARVLCVLGAVVGLGGALIFGVHWLGIV